MNGHVEPTPSEPSPAPEVEVLPQGTVFIAGGGPVGLTLATVLAFYGVKSVVTERNQTTTKWPKMDLTNVRSMELFRKLGLADELRKQGVPSHMPYNVLISTGLHNPEPVTAWHHPGVDQWRVKIAAKNDGTMPLEPWQRLSQAVFEKWLKELCDKNPLIDVRFGCKVSAVRELPNGVLVTTTDGQTGATRQVVARYLAGCDGASSIIRRSLGVPLEGGPMPVYVLLVHFKSRDLARLHAQGRFWHVFFLGEEGLNAAAISQNEKDIFTTHLLLPLDQDPESIKSEDAVYRALGGLGDPYPIKIDEILVRSTYRPNIAIVRNYSGYNGHVQLAGDAAHQNIPTGGYGMNMGIADAFELGWKMASVINGHADASILKSYEEERRPVALASIERSGVHMAVHMDACKVVDGKVRDLCEDSEHGRSLKKMLVEHYDKHDGENTDLGIEMGCRYRSRVIVPDDSKEPPWTPSEYTPTTFPGSRAPHVFLRDGSPIFDHLSKHYTLVEFSDGSERGAGLVIDAAWRNCTPVKHLRLLGEDDAHKVWERRLVLVRPDGIVAWRADQVTEPVVVSNLFAAITGRGEVESVPEPTGEDTQSQKETGNGVHAFTSTVGPSTQTTQFELERMGGFQT